MSNIAHHILLKPSFDSRREQKEMLRYEYVV